MYIWIYLDLGQCQKVVKLADSDPPPQLWTILPCQDRTQGSDFPGSTTELS